MLYIGIILIVICFILMDKAPGPAFLVLVVGLILDIIGLIRYFKKRKQPKEPPKAEPKKDEKKRDSYVSVPEMVGTAGLKYHYDNVPFIVTDAAPILSAAEKQEWDLSAEIINDVVHLSTVDGEVGYMERFDGMIGDWQRRKEPYRILLQNYNTDTGEAVCFLAFYKEGYNPLDELDDLDDDEDDDL